MKFKINMSKYKDYLSPKKNYILHIILIVILVIASLLIPVFNSGIIVGLVNILKSPVQRSLYMIAVTWLGSFTLLSLLFIALVEFHLIYEFKQLNKNLYQLIESSKIYEPGTFSTWTKLYGNIANLVEDLNENMKLYLGHTLIMSIINIMGTLYQTVVYRNQNG